MADDPIRDIIDSALAGLEILIGKARDKIEELDERDWQAYLNEREFYDNYFQAHLEKQFGQLFSGLEEADDYTRSVLEQVALSLIPSHAAEKGTDEEDYLKEFKARRIQDLRVTGADITREEAADIMDGVPISGGEDVKEVLRVAVLDETEKTLEKE